MVIVGDRHDPVPLLLLPGEDHDSPNRELFHIATNKLYKLPSLPETQNKTIFGSSFGWLLTMEYSPTSSFEIQLLNPITRAHIPLPPATTFASFHLQPYYDCPYKLFAQKAVISSQPDLTLRDCVVMTIHGCKNELGFCRIGDEKWTTLESNWIQFHDVIYVKHLGQFYAVTQEGIVVAWDVSTDPKVVEVAQPPRKHDYDKKYLVESSGELLMVTRDMLWEEDYKYKTIKFAIDRLDMTSRKWEKVTSLDDQILFLGHNGSISVSYHDTKECKPNCVYFLDDNLEAYNVLGCGCHDMGVYCLEDKSVQPFYPTTQFWSSSMFWITPKLESVALLASLQV